MPDFGILLDPPLPSSAPQESLSASLPLDSCPNLDVSTESDRNYHLGFPILQKEDELIPETDGCSELEPKGDKVQTLVSDGNSQMGLPILYKETELIAENDRCSELEAKGEEFQGLVSDKNSHLGFPILLKKDELMEENDGCGELELKGDELIPENDGCGELESKGEEFQGLVFDGNCQLGLPILQKEDESIQENDARGELESKGEELQALVSVQNSQLGLPILQKDDELMAEYDGCGELELKGVEFQKLVSDQNSQLPILQKEDELKPENDGRGKLELKEVEVQALVSDGNSQMGLPILHKEGELKPENDGCGELESRGEEFQEPVSDRNCQLGLPILQKEDELKPENDGCGELELKGDEFQQLVSDRLSHLVLPILQKEDELIAENDGCSELESKEDELGLPMQKEDELMGGNYGRGELELEGDELNLENNGFCEVGIRGLRSSSGGSVAKKSLDEYVKEWVERKVNAGVDKQNCVLPFLVHAPKSVECSVCQRSISPGDKIECSVRDCTGVFHLECAKGRLGLSSPKIFKCPRHVCYVCNKKIHLWRCIRCPLASHDKCAAFPEHVVHLNDQPGRVICWKHPSDWHLEKHEAPASNLEEIFANLPLPYGEEEFKIDINWKDMVDNKYEPPPYVHIKRNVYLIKRKRDGVNADIGCTNCRSTECFDNCVCRVQCISCSKACHCSDMCSNRPFRRDKKIKAVKTELCGWGVVAAESINKGDFIIEYIGEVIDDALCEKRLWDMKYKGDKNFYMCELRKDFTIDATFKGNLSRFLNHSCDPNCKLEKWQVEGETRVGVFAAQSIEVGEPLTYDYKFVQFGPEVKCHCGASNCQGYLGSRKKITSKLDICWGSKRKRTSTSCLTIIKSNSC